MFITAGNDFSLRYVVTEATYTQDDTIWVDVDLTQCSNIQVFLDCEEHNIHIPLDWSLEENTNNVIIANVVASTLHVGTTYGTTVTGLDANGKSFRWNCDGSDFISIVEDTNDMNLEGPTELDDIHVKIGLVSPQGPQGAQGTAGRDGVDGVQGAQGNIGNQGDKGNQGEMGYQGDKGERGITGFQGDMGQQGEQGNQGEMGYQGDKGERGITGFQGDMGQQGMKGEQGPQGDKGDKGERGITGFQGDAGAQGNRGNQGEMGDQGTQGNQGNAGIGFRVGHDNQFYVDNHLHITSSDGIFFEGSYDSNGKPVRSGAISFNSMTSPNPEIFINGEYNVDELYGTQGGNIFANDYIYVTPSGSPHSIRYKLHSITNRINELENDFGHQGPQGDKGEDGYRGRDGVQGAKGDQGEMGYQGDKGDRGITGAQGDMGQQGMKGEQGPQGDKGDKGDRGITGFQGDMGKQGAKGYQGDKGADGTMYFEDLTPEQKATLKGDQGVQGDKGDRGVDGVQGAQGDIGEKGYQGDAGVQGPKGDSTGIVGPQGTQGTQGDRGDRGPQGYGASSPAAELPKVTLIGTTMYYDDPAQLAYLILNMHVIDSNFVYPSFGNYFSSKFNITDTIDQDFRPNSSISSSNGNYGLQIKGDFDKMHINMDGECFHISKTNDTQKTPTWLAITIVAKASLFNLQNLPLGTPIDSVYILGMQYINVSDIRWDPYPYEP